MRTVWFGVLWSLFSVVASSGISDALSGAGQLSETPAPSGAAPSLLSAPMGPIALDVSSGGPAPGSIGNDHNLAARLSEYVFLHKTRNELIPARTTFEANGCPE